MTRITFDNQFLLIEKRGYMLPQYCMHGNEKRCSAFCPQLNLEGTDLKLCQNTVYENVEVV